MSVSAAFMRGNNLFNYPDKLSYMIPKALGRNYSEESVAAKKQLSVLGDIHNVVDNPSLDDRHHRSCFQ
jgi:hypothetical protein